MPARQARPGRCEQLFGGSVGPQNMIIFFYGQRAVLKQIQQGVEVFAAGGVQDGIRALGRQGGQGGGAPCPDQTGHKQTGQNSGQPNKRPEVRSQSRHRQQPPTDQAKRQQHGEQHAAHDDRQREIGRARHGPRLPCRDTPRPARFRSNRRAGSVFCAG